MPATELGRAGEQIDRYTRELQELGLDASEREVRWLNELIAHEQDQQRDATTEFPLSERLPTTDPGKSD